VVPEKKIIILAGPNGAGKTTFARTFLPAEAGVPIFVNADLIAAGLSPFDPDAAALRAGRMMLSEIDRHAAAGRSFAFETTLSGHTYLRRVDNWRAAGFAVELIFLSLGSAEEAISRVAMRVRQGDMACRPTSSAGDSTAVCETFSTSTAIESTFGSCSTIGSGSHCCWMRGSIDEEPA
jgi:predicted ABC-type ATPase